MAFTGLTGQNLPVGVVAEFSREPPFASPTRSAAAMRT